MNPWVGHSQILSRYGQSGEYFLPRDFPYWTRVPRVSPRHDWPMVSTTRHSLDWNPPFVSKNYYRSLTPPQQWSIVARLKRRSSAVWILKIFQSMVLKLSKLIKNRKWNVNVLRSETAKTNIKRDIWVARSSETINRQRRVPRRRSDDHPYFLDFGIRCESFHPYSPHIIVPVSGSSEEIPRIFGCDVAAAVVDCGLSTNNS